MAEGSLEERLVELESRYLHQERLVEELDGVVVEQRRLIDRLAGELDRLKALFEARQSEPGDHDEKPPHY